MKTEYFKYENAKVFSVPNSRDEWLDHTDHTEPSKLFYFSTDVRLKHSYLVVGNNFDFSMLEYTHTRVGGTQINADCWSLAHFFRQ